MSERLGRPVAHQARAAAPETERLWSTFVSENHRRPSGRPPYWPTGTQIIGWSGDGPLAAGAVTSDGNTSVPHFAEPVTVVRDDADALVAWLAAGTPVLRAVRADGLGKRDDKSTLFTAETVQDIGVHASYDFLRIAPTGRPWSAWAVFAEHTREFAGWYVNLEEPHVRDAHAVYTRDHVLDLEIEPDRTMARKDEDELALAVAQGCSTPPPRQRSGQTLPKWKPSSPTGGPSSWRKPGSAVST